MHPLTSYFLHLLRLTLALQLFSAMLHPALGEHTFLQVDDGNFDAGSDFAEIALPAGDSEIVAVPLEVRAATLGAIDEIVVFYTGLGNREITIELLSYRDEIDRHCDLHHCANVGGRAVQLAQVARKRSQLLFARKLMKHVVVIADFLKRDRPLFYAVAHNTMSILEFDFEEYDKARHHSSLSVKTVEKNAMIDPQIILACKANHAMVIGNSGQFAEAEKLYLQLLQSMEASPESFSTDNLLNLKFALAGLYSRNGKFEKYRDIVPHENSAHYDIKGEFVPKRAFCVAFAFVRYHSTEGNDLEKAAKYGEELLGNTQEHFGLSSRPHIELTELMADIRMSQSRHDDAIKLLQRAAELRAELLGNDHPSVACVKEQIGDIRRQSLESVPPIWKSLEILSEDAPDRYGGNPASQSGSNSQEPDSERP